LNNSEWLAELTSGDENRAESAASEVPENSALALAALEKIIGEDNLEKKWWACRALASFTDSRASKLLVGCLDDEDIAINSCAAKGLQIQPAVEAIELLVKLLDHSDALLRRLAGDALIALEFEATPALIACLQGGEQVSKIESARALAIIQDPQSIGALFETLKSGSTMMEHWAQEGLENMGLGMRFFSPEN
jgi:HEAT repeat protein